MTMVREQDVLATLYTAGRDNNFLVQITALGRLPSVSAQLPDIRSALQNVSAVGLASQDLVIVKRLKRIPFFKHIDLSQLWVAYGNDRKGKLLICLASTAPLVRVFYLWR
jgi:hypothetical protein